VQLTDWNFDSVPPTLRFVISPGADSAPEFFLGVQAKRFCWSEALINGVRYKLLIEDSDVNTFTTWVGITEEKDWTNEKKRHLVNVYIIGGCEEDEYREKIASIENEMRALRDE
jgi:hypothetical protein